MNLVSDSESSDAGWKNLYRIGGAAALVAGIVFRRNLGVEISLFTAHKPPEDVTGWFTLLQANRLLGLAYLHIFDVVNYALVALMFLALYALLRRVNPGQAAVAAVLGLLGIAAYFAANTAFSLLALSDRYAAATAADQQAALLSAGQALLALNRFSLAGAHPGSGGFLSLLLIAAAGMIFSLLMLRGKVFGRAAAVVGIVVSALDLAYCLGFVFLPAVGEVLAVACIPAAGFFYLVWHVMVGWKLLRLGRVAEKPVPQLA